MDPSAYLSALHARWLAGGIDGTWTYLDGTLVFADVSGFTSLSERLARRGRAGAEELTDIIDDVVGGLLDVAEPQGGDLLKYGGDALLLSFTGPGHEHRAAAAAAGDAGRPPAVPIAADNGRAGHAANVGRRRRRPLPGVPGG